MYTIPLDGAWKLAWIKDSELIKKNSEPSCAAALEALGCRFANASVPGNFELDLFAAGIIDDPYYSSNVLDLRKYEISHMFYYRDFISERGGNAVLHFDGIDTFADIFINGKYAGHAENMLVDHEFSLTDIKKGQNEIFVHIRPSVTESRKRPLPAFTGAMHDSADSLYVRKAPHMYGWDIMPRIVSGGIWKSVSVVFPDNDRIISVFVYTASVSDISPDRATGNASVCAAYDVSVGGDNIGEYTLKLEAVCGESRFEMSERLRHTSGKLRAEVKGARLWMPRNCGDANLYTVSVSLWRGEALLSRKELKSGIRTVTLERTSTAGSYGNGKFLFRVNGEKVFLYGTNWVPVDAFHSRDAERLPHILPMLSDLGCNAVRCWGGNVYENELFYDYCDENGIAVWQDFSMACAVYPNDRYFCGLIRGEAEKIVKRLRNHPSVILWAGDNECDLAYSWFDPELHRNPNGNLLTREIIPSVLRLHDLTRPYLPSSPYIDEEAFESGKAPSEDHLWGPRDYFKGDFYRSAVSHFASEIGYHGCPSPSSLRRFIAPEQLWPWRGENGEVRRDWLVHASCATPEMSHPFAYRIPLMASQIKELFGSEPSDMDSFIRASQISQAEAKKYFIESFRIRKWERTGIIWWNLIDGWPQISDAVVDYYGTKKLAYSYIKRSQQPFCLMADEPVVNGELHLFCVNDTRKDAGYTFTVTDAGSGELLLSGEGFSASDTSSPAAVLSYESGTHRFLLFSWRSDAGDGTNHYVTDIRGTELADYLLFLRESGFDSDFEGFC